MEWIRNWFSNMYPCDTPFIYDGIAYPTVEVFYQAMKTTDKDIRRRIASMNPYQAKKYARTIVLRPDWHNLKLKVMEWGLRAKFAKGTTWYTKLIATTGDIVETNNWNDKYFGVCNGVGENHLGRLLTKIRDEYLKS